MALTFHDLLVPRPELDRMRRELYHSEGPGYARLPGFVPPDFVRHLVDFWVHSYEPSEEQRRSRSKGDLHLGAPNYSKVRSEGRGASHFNFFWNPCADQVTQAVSLVVALVRNQVEGRPLYDELFPLEGRSTSFRVVITRQGSPVREHSDWEEDFNRLQATLFLSRWGKDYRGGGFHLESNRGDTLLFGRDIEVEPGDLVLWRYRNRHSVRDVESSPGELGFVRILYPPELCHPTPDTTGPAPPPEGGRAATRAAPTRFRQRLRRIPGVERWVRPLLHRLRGRR